MGKENILKPRTMGRKGGVEALRNDSGLVQRANLRFYKVIISVSGCVVLMMITGNRKWIVR